MFALTDKAHRMCAALTVIVTLAVAAGCSWGKDDVGMQPTETRKEAAEHVERLLKDAIAQLPGRVQTEVGLRVDTLPCDDPTDGGPLGRVIVEHDYDIHGLADKDYPEQFEILKRYWEDRGYRRLLFEKDGKSLLMKYTDSAEYRIVLGTSFDGSSLWVRASSPCIWPNGTPEPE